VIQGTSINRREFIKTLGFSTAVFTLRGFMSCKQTTTPRPNILWLVSEDNGPFLGCYGDPLAETPNLDKLASEGIMFENAYANVPVCAPARSTIITGMYACSLGTHHMRSYNRLPKHIKFFTNYLREAGYYCSNNAKEDYNVAKKHKVELPNEIIGIVRCSNPTCVSNANEPVKSRFKVINKDPTRIKCYFCEREPEDIADRII